jgi:hypothetical protein
MNSLSNCCVVILMSKSSVVVPVAGSESFFIAISISGDASVVRLGVGSADFHEEYDSENGESDDQNEVHNECPSNELCLFVLFLDPAILSLHLLSASDCLSRSGSVNGELCVHKCGRVDGVIVSHVRHRDDRVGSEVLVESLEGGEGMEHLRTVGSRCFSGEGVVRQVVLGFSVLGGRDSTLEVVRLGLSSGTMSKDFLSAVSVRVELSGLGVFVLRFRVVLGVVVGIASSRSNTSDAEGFSAVEVLLDDLLVDHVQGVDVGGVSSSSSLSRSVDVRSREVSVGASERKVKETTLTVPDFVNLVGICVAIDSLNSSSLGSVSGTSADLDVCVAGVHETSITDNERSDFGVVNDGITGLEVVVGVALRVSNEANVLNERGVPSENEFL